MSCIWYISKYVAPPSNGGAGGRGYLIMRELSRLGHKCVVITSDSHHLAQVPVFSQPYLRQDVDGMIMLWVRTFKYSVAKSLRRIVSWLDFEWRLWRMPKTDLPKPDVLVVSSLSLLTIFNGLLLRRIYGCRLIFEIRDIWPLTITEEGGFNRLNPVILGLSWIESLGYKHADAIVGTMPNLSAHVAEVLGYKKHTYCIPMGIDDDSMLSHVPLPADYAKQYIPLDKFVVVHAGTIGITNALDTFFACADLMKENTDIHFLVVGDGDLRKHYQDRYGHLKNLSFAPKVDKAMVQGVLSKCDLLYFSVHASKVWNYGQSLNKLIDYMLAGKPIVASYTGYQSMINEAGCGNFVPAADMHALRSEIERFASMSNMERASIGGAGKAWIIANRSYKQLARNYFEIMIGPKPESF